LDAEKVLQMYLRNMTKAKWRMQAILDIQKRKKSTTFDHTNVKFVALQIRKILELIILSPSSRFFPALSGLIPSSAVCICAACRVRLTACLNTLVGMCRRPVMLADSPRSMSWNFFAMWAKKSSCHLVIVRAPACRSPIRPRGRGRVV